MLVSHTIIVTVWLDLEVFSWHLVVCLSYYRRVEDLQFRVEEESITKGDLEVFYDIIM